MNTSLIILVLTFLAFNTAVDDRCNFSSPDCCWISQIMKFLKLPGVEPGANGTGCCGKNGVACRGKSVTKFIVSSKKIYSSIPTLIGNLVNLEDL